MFPSSSKSQSQSSTSTSSLVWYGHLPCVCSSTKGCNSHVESETDAFYNPLLPPNAPARLVCDGNQSRISRKRPRNSFGSELSGLSRPSRSKEQEGFFQGVSNRLRNRWSRRSSSPKSHIEAQHPPQDHSMAEDDPPAYSPPAYSELEQFTTHLQQPPPFWSASTLEPGSDSGVSYYPGHCPTIDSSWSQMSVKINPMDPRVVPRTILPFEEASFATLAPLHPSMPYHLAFYHLHWARRAIEKRDALKETSRLMECAGESLASPNNQAGPRYQWSSELYWTTKLVQKQELRYRVDARGTNNSGIDIIHVPPHHRVSGPVADRERIRRSLGVGDRNGRLAKLHICPICYCDLEQSLEVRGNEVHVRFTVYKDLGDGIDRFDPKWRALLTGEGSGTTRQHARYIDGPQKYQVYWQVWQAAYFLKRPNLHLVRFKTGSGEDFNGLYRINITDPRMREEARDVVAWTGSSSS
ncbi:hypothetical protein PG991_012253 [Apiospora marii]|uniref:HNH nuclease domain-containing protein n=1 Tax=Apiospora marii TaxID=335849 RepID=A0ABR1R9D9_9PEZI